MRRSQCRCNSRRRTLSQERWVRLRGVLMRLFVCEFAFPVTASGLPNCVCDPAFSPPLDVQAPLAVNLNWRLVTLLRLTSYCQVSLATSDILLSVWFQLLS